MKFVLLITYFTIVQGLSEIIKSGNDIVEKAVNKIKIPKVKKLAEKLLKDLD